MCIFLARSVAIMMSSSAMTEDDKGRSIAVPKVDSTNKSQDSRRRSNFAENLKTLCSFYRSISDICRKLQINRSQFNKYLTGTTRPSIHNMRRIEAFFGIEEYELYVPPRKFAQLMEQRPGRPSAESEFSFESHISNLQRASSSGIRNYDGLYFEYYLSMTYPGHILRALVDLRCTESTAYYKRIERLSPVHRGERRFRCVYLGMAFYLADRIYLVDYESLTSGEITQTICFPSYKSRTTYLSGVKLGISSDSRHTPSSTRVLFEYLGREVELKQAIRQCGLFDESSDKVSEEIKLRIRNTIKPTDFHLVPWRL